MISYGSVKNRRNARLETLGKQVIKITEEKPSAATILMDE
jgi:hypothetical protein